MALNNTLTDLAPILYSAAQEVSNEPSGVIDAINMNFDSKGVAIGDSVKVPVAPVATTTDFIASMTMPDGSDKIADEITVKLTHSKKTSWHLTGEQRRSLENGGTDQEWIRQLIAQGMRALRNEAEQEAASAIYKNASRGVGTAGTTPFTSDINLIAEARKVLMDNGAPLSDLQLVLDSSAIFNLQKLAIYQQSAQAGSDQERRTGLFLPQFGFNIRPSAGISSHVKGTATGFDATATVAVGGVTIACDGSNSGTILPGDMVRNQTKYTAGTDTNWYVVSSGGTLSGAASGNFLINRPGVRVTVDVANEFVIGANYVPNLAFERNAVVGIMRPPLFPENPAIKQIPISDGKGMTYLLVEIAGYGATTWELHLAYGFKVVQPEHVAIVMG